MSSACDDGTVSGSTVPEPQEIAAAVLVDGDRVLMCRRNPSRQWYPNIWDLPGGHIEPGEMPADALVRELREELGVTVDPADLEFSATLQPEPWLTVHVWVVRSWSGELSNRAPAEHDSLGWFSQAQVAALELPSPVIVDLCAEALRVNVDSVAGMRDHDLAQLNIGRLLAPTDSPVVAEFMEALDEVNALADRSPGFVWRFQTDEGNATAERPFPDDTILVNLSTWESIDALSDYVYRTVHAEYLRRRREWFERLDEVGIVLWWVPTGHRPSVAEAIERLEHLQQHGSTHRAFTFRHRFEAPRTDG